VGHLQNMEIAGLEPAKIVVFLRFRVEGFPFPARDEERVHLESGVRHRHRDGSRVVDVDTDFFKTFARDGFVRQLARLDVSADELPAVGVPPTRWITMHQQRVTIANKQSKCDGNPGDHGGTLSASTDALDLMKT